jgi:hypothetical protein
MSGVSYSQTFSSRGQGDGLEITATFHFAGDGITLVAVEEQFTSLVKSFADEHGLRAAQAISATHEADEAAMRSAIHEALGRVSPEQRAVLVERYDLATEGM